MADSCATCFFFQNSACHIDPPIAVQQTGLLGSGVVASWPPVASTDWCGRFNACYPSVHVNVPGGGVLSFDGTTNVPPVTLTTLSAAPSGFFYLSELIVTLGYFSNTDATINSIAGAFRDLTAGVDLFPFFVALPATTLVSNQMLLHLVNPQARLDATHDYGLSIGAAVLGATSGGAVFAAHSVYQSST